MADYSVRLTGQDNLSPTLNKAKQSLNELGGSSNKLDKISEKFKRIEASAAPIKTKLRDIQKLLSEMNFNGQSNTTQFTEMADAAAKYKDAINDANNAVRLLSSDTAGLQAGIQALQGLAGTAGILTGAMGLLGIENQKVQQSILKVQSAIALMNGVQQIANILNKDSILMLKLKQLWKNANANATKTETTALGANTIAQNINNGTTKKGTIFQNAWNVAKAIGMAMVGNFTGLILVGAGALLTYALATADSTEELETQSEALDTAKSDIDEYNSAVAKATGELVGRFHVLRTEWNALKTEAEKTEWIEKNQSAFNDLGIEIYSVLAAEYAFNSHTGAIVNAMTRRAKAAAALSHVEQVWKDYFENQDKLDYSYSKGISVSKGDDINKQPTGTTYEEYAETYNRWHKEWDNQKNGLGDPVAYWSQGLSDLTFTEAGAAAFNRILNQVRKESYEKQVKANLASTEAKSEKYSKIYMAESQAANEALVEIQNDIDANTDNLIEKAKATKKKLGAGNGSGKGSGKSGKGKGADDQTKTKLEIYREFESEAKEVSNEYNVGLIDKDEAIKRIQEINKKISDSFGEDAVKIKIEFDDPITKYQELERNAREIQDKFDLGLLSEDSAKKAIDALNEEAKRAVSSNIPNKMLFNLELEPPKNILDDYQKKIEDAEALYLSVDPKIDPTKSKALYDEWQKALQQYSDKEIELKIKAVPSYEAERKNGIYEKGSIQDKRISQQNVWNDAEQYAYDFTNGLIDEGAFRSKIQQLNDILKNELNLNEPIEIKINATGNGVELLKTAEEKSQKLKEEQDALRESVLNAAGEFVNLGSALANVVEDESGKKAILIATAIGQVALGFAQALASPAATAGGPWVWIAAAISGAATMATLIAQLKGFADGGIISSNSFHGDQNLIRVNGGEMILNQKQQSNLFRMLNNGGGNKTSGQVEFVIKGTTLQGVLNNTNKKLSRQ